MPPIRNARMTARGRMSLYWRYEKVACLVQTDTNTTQFRATQRASLGAGASEDQGLGESGADASEARLARATNRILLYKKMGSKVQMLPSQGISLSAIAR